MLQRSVPNCCRQSAKCSILDLLPTRQQDVAAMLQRCLSVRPSDVAGTSQMKHPTTSQWYVFPMSYWFVMTTSHGDVMTSSHQCVSVTFHVSFKHQIKHFSSTNQVGNKGSSLVYKLVELLLNLKTASYNINICNKFLSKTIYSLKEEP